MKFLSPAKVTRAYMNKTVTTALRTPVVEYTGMPANTQHYGFEAEIEGNGCQARAMQLPQTHWRLDRDGSLRGESIEPVFTRPLTMVEANQAFDQFAEQFNGFDDSAMSDRTSVHVHYDVSTRTMHDLQKMLVGFYMFENLAFRQAGGQQREGNRFCLRNCDSETPLKALIDGYQAGDVFYYLRESARTARYSNLNLQALRKFGSLEVRCHRGSVDADDFRKWLAVVDEIFTVSATFKEARNIIEDSSEMGTMQFLAHYYPRLNAYTRIMAGREPLIYEGIDFAQMLAYCVNIVDKKTKKKSGPLRRRRPNNIEETTVQVDTFRAADLPARLPTETRTEYRNRIYEYYGGR